MNVRVIDACSVGVVTSAGLASLDHLGEIDPNTVDLLNAHVVLLTRQTRQAANRSTDLGAIEATLDDISKALEPDTAVVDKLTVHFGSEETPLGQEQRQEIGGFTTALAISRRRVSHMESLIGWRLIAALQAAMPVLKRDRK